MFDEGVNVNKITLEISRIQQNKKEVQIGMFQIYVKVPKIPEPVTFDSVSIKNTNTDSN